MRAIDIEPAQFRQRGDDVFADAVGEIFLLRLAAHVDERQHGDGGTVEQRLARLERLAARLRRAPLEARWCGRGRGGIATSPTKRKPLRAMVRITLWSWPLSPTALRAALMRLVSVDSETMRPCQMFSIRSSLVTTWSRFSHQIHQQIEHLRLDRDDLAAAAQFAAVGVKQMVGKLELQRCVPDCGECYDNRSATGITSLRPCV